ncbi:MAG: 1,2-phenylacetyl-CoA epoxidase subunit PaaD [Actinomycetes bacterium]|nr:MAG: phenylacetate-CoA oxygenase subunit PaaJ [Actinomycetota bacterium]
MRPDARSVAASVVDPEIPVLTIGDLGILRDVEVDGDRVTVTITPTYSGCPAMRQIEDDLRKALTDAGYAEVEVRTVLTPAWSTDTITEEGRRKLAGFGIAPPDPEHEVLCPRCRADGPRLVARFGSTACKALMVCSSCGEPFDWFKEL